MKLSEIRGERVFDVIADVIEPITIIATDDEAAKLFHRDEVPEGMTAWQFFLQKVRESLPHLIRSHKNELVAILSTMKGVSAEEYVEGLTFQSFFADMMDLITDAEFVSFF